MKTEGRGRKWMWWSLGGALASQFYFVQELVVVFAFFAIGFAAIAFVLVSLYCLQKGWELAVMRILDSERVAEQRLPTGVSVRADQVSIHHMSNAVTAQLFGRIDAVQPKVAAEGENEKPELEREHYRSVGKVAA